MIKKSFLLVIFLSLAFKSLGQDSTSVKYKIKEKSWYIPDYVKLQFAGNIGFLSAGVGYKLIAKTWYTEFLYGFVPKTISEAKPVHLITNKNTFTLFTKELGNHYTISPITGFTATLETGNNSYLKFPDQFPRGYYVTNAVHFTIFGGVNVHKYFPDSKVIKAIDFYYEVGTVETYFYYAVTSKEVSLDDVFSSSIGVNFYF